jgi:hypothetical protein
MQPDALWNQFLQSFGVFIIVGWKSAAPSAKNCKKSVFFSTMSDGATAYPTYG